MELSSSDDELPTFSMLLANSGPGARRGKECRQPGPSPKKPRRALEPVDEERQRTTIEEKRLAAVARKTERERTDGDRQKTVIEEKQLAALARKAERERERTEKKRQKELDKAIKKASREASKEKSPTERVKQMILVLDVVLSENTDFMAELTQELREMGVGYWVTHGNTHPGSVRWRRRVVERDVDSSAKITERATEKEEHELLVTLEAQGFVGLVHYTKQADNGVSLPSGAQTLMQYVEGIRDANPGMSISLAVEGMDAFLRGKKTKFNRQFRQAVTGLPSSSSSSSSSFSDVSRVDCEEAMVGLQLALGVGVRMFSNAKELAEYVVTMTKAIADQPFKTENPFSFHVESGSGASRKALEEATNKVALIWKHQLMQLNNMSENMASAVVTAYPSPAHLLKEYESLSDKKAAESLLQDIPVRRGVGVVASVRRLGPVQSKRIHTLMTSKDTTITLT